MIPDNITREHIRKAISEISPENVPPRRKSVDYDLVENGKKLPPKFVIGIANKYANGDELESDDYNAKEARDFLLKKGFKVIEKHEEESNQPKYWVEKTIINGRPDRIEGDRSLGKALWSPQRDKRGADIYKNMRNVEEGDIVLHLINNKEFSGVSIVKNEAIKTEGLSGTDWDEPAYLIELEDYTELDPRINRAELLNDKNKDILDKISSNSEVFYTENLNLRQGAYLTPCPKGLVYLINKIHLDKTGKKLPLINKIENNLSFIVQNETLNILDFKNSLNDAGLIYSEKLIVRFIASLLTKPFVILTGLSGSGKTKLAQAFVQWMCEDKTQYRIVPVGADWTNREPLLGYPNALQPEEYVKPDNGVLDLINQASNKPELPHFLILDEMNLSHVERYFADFLSVMESNEEIHLHSESKVKNGVPAKLKIPTNLYVIGTVNIDETTNMFSPKVLDRANTIEFHITANEMQEFLVGMKDIDMKALNTKGAGKAKSFLEMSTNRSFDTPDIEEINKILIHFFGELKNIGAEFGYRSASEILRLINQLTELDESFSTSEKIDIAIMQKLLPKLHGSRRKLCPVLESLGKLCVKENEKIVSDIFENQDYDFHNDSVLYPISLEKIARMYRGAVDNGFASYAEA